MNPAPSLKRLSLLLLAGWLGSVTPVAADEYFPTIEWNNSSTPGGNWVDLGNWLRGGWPADILPTALDSAVVANGISWLNPGETGAFYDLYIGLKGSGHLYVNEATLTGTLLSLGQEMEYHKTLGTYLSGQLTINNGHVYAEYSSFGGDRMSAGGTGKGTLVVNGGSYITNTIVLNTGGGSSEIRVLSGSDGYGVLGASYITSFSEGTPVTVLFDGGILRSQGYYAGTAYWFHNVSSAVSIGAGGMFADTNGENATFHAPLAGLGTLTKQGAGDLLLEGEVNIGGLAIETGNVTLRQGGSYGGLSVGTLESALPTMVGPKLTLEARTHVRGSAAIGAGINSHAEVDVGASSFIVEGTLAIGAQGSGELTVAGGEVIASKLVVSALAPGLIDTIGVFDLQGGEVQVMGSLIIGEGGNGTFNLNGGKLTSGYEMILGETTHSVGYLNVNGGEVTSPGGNLVVLGHWGHGHLTLDDGEVQAESFVLAREEGSLGVLSVNGGTLTANGFYSGWGGLVSVVNLDGGAIHTRRFYASGELAGTRSTVALSSGELHADELYFNGAGTGEMTVHAATVRSTGGVEFGGVGSQTLTLGRNEAGAGVLETARVHRVAGDGSVKVNLNGGVLRALGSRGDFVSGFASGEISVGPDGVMVDTNGFSVGIQSALNGGGTVTVEGGGRLTLAARNRDLTGNFVVNGATLALEDQEALGSGSVWVRAGGTIAYGGDHLQVNDVMLEADGRLTREASEHQQLAFSVVRENPSAHRVTRAQIIDGVAQRSLVMEVGFLEATGHPFEVLSLSGLGVGESRTGGSAQFTLSISITGALSQASFLAWYDEGSGQWVDAVLGNSSGTPYFVGERAYNPATDFHLGFYGFDRVSQTHWAVLDYEGQFAVIPEPASVLLLLAGLGLAFKAGRRRR